MCHSAQHMRVHLRGERCPTTQHEKGAVPLAMHHEAPQENKTKQNITELGEKSALYRDVFDSESL